jgi:hypothetical protein
MNHRVFTKRDICKLFQRVVESKDHSNVSDVKKVSTSSDLQTSRLSTFVSMNGYSPNSYNNKSIPIDPASLKYSLSSQLPKLKQKYSNLRDKRTRISKNSDVIKETPQNSFRKYYNSREGRFSKQPIGEFLIPRHCFQLADSKQSRLHIPHHSPKTSHKVGDIKQSMQHILNGDKGPRSYTQVWRNTVKKIKELKITADDMNNLNTIIPKAPYDLPNSKEFISACKHGSLQIVEKFIIENRLIVHVFDSLGMTGLHWAAARNRVAIMNLLISSNSKLDAKDFVTSIQFNRTPLHLAAKSNSASAVELLISKKADPFVFTLGKKKAVHLGSSEHIQTSLKRYMTVRYI